MIFWKGFGNVRKWLAHLAHILTHTCKHFPTSFKTTWIHPKHLQKSCRVFANCFHMSWIGSWCFVRVSEMFRKCLAHLAHILTHTCKRFPTPVRTSCTHRKHIQMSCRVISNCFHMFASCSRSFGMYSETFENAWHMFTYTHSHMWTFPTTFQNQMHHW